MIYTNPDAKKHLVLAMLLLIKVKILPGYFITHINIVISGI